MMSLSVWLPGPMFLPGQTHPPPGTRKVGGTHPIRMLNINPPGQYFMKRRNPLGVTELAVNGTRCTGVVPTCLRGMVRPLPICPFFILLSSSGFPFCCNKHKQKQDNPTVNNNNNQGLMSARRSSSAQRSLNVCTKFTEYFVVMTTLV